MYIYVYIYVYIYIYVHIYIYIYMYIYIYIVCSVFQCVWCSVYIKVAQLVDMQCVVVCVLQRVHESGIVS